MYQTGSHNSLSSDIFSHLDKQDTSGCNFGATVPLHVSSFSTFAEHVHVPLSWQLPQTLKICTSSHLDDNSNNNNSSHRIKGCLQAMEMQRYELCVGVCTHAVMCFLSVAESWMLNADWPSPILGKMAWGASFKQPQYFNNKLPFTFLKIETSCAAWISLVDLVNPSDTS